jgi:hypothetical protein
MRSNLYKLIYVNTCLDTRVLQVHTAYNFIILKYYKIYIISIIIYVLFLRGKSFDASLHPRASRHNHAIDYLFPSSGKLVAEDGDSHAHVLVRMQVDQLFN